MAWMPALATVFGSIMASKGQSDTNDTNLQIQQNNSAFNAEEAAKNRQFQDEQAARQMGFQAAQADTVWQRGVKDMQAAGLNPMLAYSQGGNPSPAGAAGAGSVASAGPPGNMQNPFASAGQSAVQWAQLERTQAETDNIKAETDLKKEEVKKKPWEIRIVELESDIKKIEQKLQSARDNHSIDRAQAERDKVVEEAKAVKAEAQLKGLEIPKAINEAAAEKSWWKKEVAPFLNDANKVSGAAAAARRAATPFQLRRP